MRFLPLFAQPSGHSNTDDLVSVKSIGILRDRGYSIKTIQTATLAFSESLLQSLQSTKYWYKIEAANSSRYAQQCFLTVFPNLDNTLFYYDEDDKRWIAQRGGIKVATNNERSKGRMRLPLQGGKITTLYVMVSLGDGHSMPQTVKPQVILEKERIVVKRDHFFTTAWIVSLTVLLILFLNSLHIYCRFRDRTILYFLIVQLGGMVYLTAYRSFFQIIFPGPPFSLSLMTNGICFAYGINEVFMHLSVAIILYGFVQMTRHYLRTKITLPGWDVWLRYSLYMYILFTAVVGLINIGGFYLESYSLLYDNMLVLLVMGLSLATSIIGYRRKLPSARAYLFAHALPLVFLMGIAGYHVLITFNNNGRLLLPDLGVISQALCFSSAIVARIKILQNTLRAKEQEAYWLALDIKQAELRHRELASENEQIQTALREAELEQKIKQLEAHQLNQEIADHQVTNTELNEKLEVSRRELASTTLYVVQKNAMLAELKTQIQNFNKQSPNSKNQQLSGIKSLLQSNLHLDEDWNRFKLHFEQVHPRFFEDLQLKYPALTKNELRLYSYFHINLSTKEISALLNIDPASVRRAKTRLYKKMAIVDGTFRSDDAEQSFGDN